MDFGHHLGICESTVSLLAVIGCELPMGLCNSRTACDIHGHFDGIYHECPVCRRSNRARRTDDFNNGNGKTAYVEILQRYMGYY
jgi:hypothetical protein